MKVRLNLDYAAIQGTYWMFSTVGAVFVSSYMLAKGYSNAAIGFAIAIGNISAVFIQMAVSNLIDNVKAVTHMKAAYLMIVLLFVFTLGIIIIDEKSLIMTVVYTLLIIIYNTLHPIINTLSFKLSESGYYVNYGFGRSSGSLFAGISCVVTGYLVPVYGVNIIPLSGLLFIVLLFIFAVDTDISYKKACAMGALKGCLNSESTEHGKEKENIAIGEFLIRNKPFFVMGIGVVCLFFGNVVLENFTVQIVRDIGGNVEQVGEVMGLLCILEMPAMIFFDKLKSKMSYSLLLSIGAFFFSLKIVMILFANSMTILYIAQLNQILGFGLVFPGMVRFIDDKMDKREAVRGQGIFTAAIAMGNVLGCSVGGLILDAYTPKTLLLVSSLISVCGSILVACTVCKIERVDKANLNIT